MPRRRPQHDSSHPIGEGAIEREFGVPIPGKVVAKESWTQTALKKLPKSGPLDIDKLFGRQAPLVVDIGCGNGQFHAFLKAHPDYKNCRYLGVDCCEKQINNAENSAEHSSSSFFCRDMNEMLMFEPYFDAVYFIESIGYTTNLDVLVKTISVGLKTGGKVIIKNPIKVVHDEEVDGKYQEKFANIEKEYGYSEESLGMLPNKSVIEEIFLENGFEVEKIEVPSIDVTTYNKTFCDTDELCEAHPSYIDHIQKNEYENYAPNRYHECMVFVFKKVAEAINHVSELPYISKSYNEGIEKSQIEPNHPNAPYMQRYGEYRQRYIAEHPEQADFVQVPCEEKISYDGSSVSTKISLNSDTTPKSIDITGDINVGGISTVTGVSKVTGNTVFVTEYDSSGKVQDATEDESTISYGTSFSSSSVAEDTTSDSRVINLNVSYEIDESAE